MLLGGGVSAFSSSNYYHYRPYHPYPPAVLSPVLVRTRMASPPSNRNGKTEGNEEDRAEEEEEDRYIISFTRNTEKHHNDEKYSPQHIDVDLELLSQGELLTFRDELEELNEACTEDATQTHPLCDVIVKEERDMALGRIEALLQDWENTIVVDMGMVQKMMTTPWLYDLDTVQKTIANMEQLNSDCTEEGQQTNPGCDVLLKKERDAAIELLTSYLTSIQQLVATSAALSSSSSSTSETTNDKEEERKEVLPAVVDDVSSSSSSFAMEEIRECVQSNPGSTSIEIMTRMQHSLEAQQIACTEDATQTTAACEVELKDERNRLIEALTIHIQNATNINKKNEEVPTPGGDDGDGPQPSDDYLVQI